PEPPMWNGQANGGAVQVAAPAQPRMVPAPAPALPAKMVVALPAGARLFVDNQPVQTTPGETTFSTPPLPEGVPHYYQLRAGLVENGQTVSETLRVVVQPGRESWVSSPRLQLASAGVPPAAPAPTATLPPLMPLMASLEPPVAPVVREV